MRIVTILKFDLLAYIILSYKGDSIRVMNFILSKIYYFIFRKCSIKFITK